MALLPQSTTYTRSFKMVSSSDHISLKTGANPSVQLSKSGGAFAAAAGIVAETGNGWYTVALTAADTATLGDLAFYITGSGADDTDFCDQVGPLSLVLIDGKSLPAALAYIAASVAGLVSGAGSGTETFTGLDGTTTRLIVTVDSNGNRTGVLYG